MIFRRILKHRGLGINLIAGFCFLMLAVYGWGLSWKAIGEYLLILLFFFGVIIGSAALLGWGINKIKTLGKKRDNANKKNDE